MKVLITGACGFVGRALVEALPEHRAGLEILGIDNLSRRGSETNLGYLNQAGVRFIHGDLRDPNDLDALPRVDWVLDCAADPSVMGGITDAGSTAAQVVGHNLKGTLNLLEYCRRSRSGLILMSTSRVYSIEHLNALPLERDRDMCFKLKKLPSYPVSGVSGDGISEFFPTSHPLSLYGAAKLASEIMSLEYGSAFSFPVWVNRCGALAGPGQFGKVDQGILGYWLYSYILERPLSYFGYGGKGLQVRDFLCVKDLAELLLKQMDEPLTTQKPRVVNIGGGLERSLSLAELTDWCDNALGKKKNILAHSAGRPFDIPYYVSDMALAARSWEWRPRTSLQQTLESIWKWALENKDLLKRF